MLLIPGRGVHMFPPSSHEEVKRVEVCLPKKKKKKIQQLQSVHSLPENIQNLTKKKKGIEKLYSKTEPTEVLDSNQNMRIKKEKKKENKEMHLWHPFTIFMCICRQSAVMTRFHDNTELCRLLPSSTSSKKNKIK